MTKVDFTTKKREYKNLSDVQRGQLEEMGLRLGVNQSTISRELRRGRTRQMDYNHQYYDRYIGDSGARVYKENRLHSKSKRLNEFLVWIRSFIFTKRTIPLNVFFVHEPFIKL